MWLTFLLHMSKLWLAASVRVGSRNTSTAAHRVTAQHCFLSQRAGWYCGMDTVL